MAVVDDGVVWSRYGAVGGYSQSMDFAPVMVGYWNCRDDDHVNSPADVGAMNVNFTAQIQHAQHLRTWTLFFEAVCVSCGCGGVPHVSATSASTWYGVSTYAVQKRKQTIATACGAFSRRCSLWGSMWR